MHESKDSDQTNIPPDIIYVMGTGRSGTTIAEVLLSNSPEIAGAGESTHIFSAGFQENGVCACGAETSSCDLWSAVREDCAWTDADVSRGAEIFEKFSKHSNFPAIAIGLGGKAAKEDFRKFNTALYSSIARMTGARAVVDASKYALRALSLARLYPGRTFILCLTRSPEGLLHSFSKPNKKEQRPKSTLSTVYYYIYVLACIRIVSWLCGSQVFYLRYEEFVSEPEKALERIEQWTGIDLSASRKKLAANDYLDIGHMVTGNRLRYKKRIQFRMSNGEHNIAGWNKKTAALVMNLFRTVIRL
jgi:hypothetical protein